MVRSFLKLSPIPCGQVLKWERGRGLANDHTDSWRRQHVVWQTPRIIDPRLFTDTAPGALEIPSLSVYDVVELDAGPFIGELTDDQAHVGAEERTDGGPYRLPLN